MRASHEPLCTQHDVALLDLDGVVYVGADAVPGIPEVIESAAAAGMRFGYVTNNASRTPHQVGEHLRDLGIAATDDEVITSSQAASRVLAERLPAGSPVLIIGAQALADEVQRAGLRAVWSAQDDPVGVVQGYSPELSWAMLAEACVAIRAAALWVATNTDATLPSPRGPMPGNGSFVQVVAATTGATPLVAGKPEPAMHAECVLRTGAERPLVVGDRLDTDIEGAVRAGVPSLLVLSGLTRAADLLAAPPGQRPTYLAPDLAGILMAHPGVERTDAGARCGAWRVTEHGDQLVLARLSGTDSSAEEDAQAPTTEDCAALRALAVLAWESGTTPTVSGDPAAAAVLTRLGLPAQRLTSPLTGRYEPAAAAPVRGRTVVGAGFGTVARIVRGAASDAVRGSRRAAEVTSSFLRAHVRDPLRLIGRPARAGRASGTGPAEIRTWPVLAAPPSVPRRVPSAAVPAPAEATQITSAPATAAKATAKQAPAKATAKPAPAKKTTARKSAAKKTTAKKSAKKVTAKKLAVTKAEPATPPDPPSVTAEPGPAAGPSGSAAAEDDQTP